MSWHVVLYFCPSNVSEHLCILSFFATEAIQLLGGKNVHLKESSQAVDCWEKMENVSPDEEDTILSSSFKTSINCFFFHFFFQKSSLCVSTTTEFCKSLGLGTKHYH